MSRIGLQQLSKLALSTSQPPLPFWVWQGLNLQPSVAIHEVLVTMVLCAGLSGINKPVIVADWLNVAKPEEDYIIILDADMIMRQPLDPVAMGVKPGAVPRTLVSGQVVGTL